jgi:hypothetical protein
MLDDADHEAIVHEAVQGRAVREIARSRKLMATEVEHILDIAAERAFNGEQLRRDLLIEVRQLRELKQKLWDRAVKENDLTAAAVYVKCSERLASMIGLNMPAAFSVNLIQAAPSQERPTSTARFAAVIERLAAEQQKPNGGDEGEAERH